MNTQTLKIRSACVLVCVAVVFMFPGGVSADTSFWDGTDVSDSGPGGLLDYSMQKELYDKLLEALPVDLQADGLPVPTGGICGEMVGQQSNRGLNRMYNGELEGPRGLRVPCEKGKCWEGYTLINAFFGPGPGSGPNVLIDMDGNIVKSWLRSGGSFFGAGKMLPGGYLVSSEGRDLVERNWCDNVVKRFANLGNHHDHQRQGSTVGYYYPGQTLRPDGGMSLSLANATPPVEDTLFITNVKRFYPTRNDRRVQDDVIREIPWDWDGTNALFEWNARDHFDEFGFDEAAEYAMDLGLNSGGCGNGANSLEDWSHGNSVAWLGNNKWYTKYQDERFNPDNIIADFRSLNATIIIARHDHPMGDWEAGDIVWKLGPDYGTDGPDGKVGQIIGQHMAYMIPDTLPGGGNILVFDNGGGAGYGALIEGLKDPTTGEALGFWPNKYRSFSRVLEIDPMTKQIVWQYVQAKPSEDGARGGVEDGEITGNEHVFYSNIMGGAQRLPNGNTLITEADTGRVFEVTTEGEVVWEYAPDWVFGGGFFGSVYRAYRVPASWIPKGHNAVCE